MKNHSSKTSTDLMLESYFAQEKLNFQFEPYSANPKGGKNPDYLFITNKKKVLVENKEIEQIPFDTAPTYVHSFNPRVYYDILRRRIDSAASQLKPYKDDVNFCIVLLGKMTGYEIKLDDLFLAMYGDPVIRITIDTRTGRSVEKPYFDMTAVGALRKNHPQTKQMMSYHNYISGVGLIKAFNGLRYYEHTVMSPIMEGFYAKHKDKPLSQTMHEFLRIYDENWSVLKQKIPSKYRDPSKIFYKIELIVNPLSAKPITKNIFNSEWDIVQSPTVSG